MHEAITDREAHVIENVMGYIRLAIYIELGVFAIYWIALFVVALIIDARSILLSLIVPGIHFVAPFAALEILNFFEEKWLRTQRVPATYEILRWIAQGIIPLISDSIALASAVLVHVPELNHEGHTTYAIFYLVFHIALLASTVALTLAMLLVWRMMTTLHARQSPTSVRRDTESQQLLAGLRSGKHQ